MWLIADNRNKKIVLKICAPFTDSTSKINNTEVDHTTEIDVVIPMYNLIKYSDNFSKTSESLSQWYRNEPMIIVTFLIFLTILVMLRLNLKTK